MCCEPSKVNQSVQILYATLEQVVLLLRLHFLVYYDLKFAKLSTESCFALCNMKNYL